MKHRKLGNHLEVSSLGLGCMGMSTVYGPPADRKEMIKLIRAAHDQGVTLFDTADSYGPFLNEELVGQALLPIRQQVFISPNFGYKLPPATDDSRNGTKNRTTPHKPPT